MATVVFINRLQPADGERDALIGLLREFADSMNSSGHIRAVPTGPCTTDQSRPGSSVP
jgi:hypothetical protein